MNNLEQVQAIREQMLSEGAEKPDIVRQMALACLGWPYVFGAWGEECTPTNRKRRVRYDHPTIVSRCPALNGKSCADCQWGIGVRMFDCRGFTAWLLREVGLDLTGQGATSQYNTASNWTQRGRIADMPDVVCCVFKQSNGKMEHTGMHIGGGTIIHCSSGVQTGKTSDRGWTHYAIPAGLYGEAIPMGKPTLRRGDRGESVRELQETLNRIGYDCGRADGVFGTNTETAVKRFQTANGLKADGIVGKNTWAALDQPQETYRVTIEGATLAQYKRILEICPQAECYKEG